MSSIDLTTGRWTTGNAHDIMRPEDGMGRIVYAKTAAMFYAFLTGGQGITLEMAVANKALVTALDMHAKDSQIPWAITVLGNFQTDLNQHGEMENAIVRSEVGDALYDFIVNAEITFEEDEDDEWDEDASLIASAFDNHDEDDADDEDDDWDEDDEDEDAPLPPSLDPERMRREALANHARRRNQPTPEEPVYTGLLGPNGKPIR